MSKIPNGRRGWIGGALAVALFAGCAPPNPEPQPSPEPEPILLPNPTPNPGLPGETPPAEPADTVVIDTLRGGEGPTRG